KVSKYRSGASPTMEPSVGKVEFSEACAKAPPAWRSIATSVTTSSIAWRRILQGRAGIMSLLRKCRRAAPRKGRRPLLSVAARLFRQLQRRGRHFEIVAALAFRRDLDPALGSTVRTLLHHQEVECAANLEIGAERAADDEL